ncbi:uncharacterized protein K452DRAFT_321205 [Aplosporella prunicola CBS 121167]|uniref:Uncharacterized protein n=1 Tax=Aplosporella prunicola CBS 121167 TaxID=1176127 RepID=A0A6A6B331_9PEZI|nr:uncharacterized protein K452DRAFT_321205 [Aplosporella prunicola CBS 121167]KAF2138226.1 hypothetical protein K452DRAFT_321205 [Aplosporella prunicola CBS 121167]
MAYGGLLERKNSEPLVDLLGRFTVTLFAFLLLKKIKKANKVENKLAEYKLCIAVHGEQKNANAIGELLGNSEIYLQPPQAFQPSVPYFNPQYLYRPGTEDMIQDSYNQSTECSSSAILADDDPLKYKVLQVFDSAEGPQHFAEIRASSRLRTSLKPHQVKALSMMMEKESGRLDGNEFGTMWAPFTHIDGKIRYRNTAIDFVQSEKPHLCLGGLLADEMGLGKTLSMLALITLQLDRMKNPNAKHADSSPIQTTLIITPMSVLQIWEEQIKRHTHPGTLSYCVYHGSSRQNSWPKLNEFDIVLTTYDTLVSESEARKRRNREAKALNGLKWHRIVLDEAHMIRNPSSKRHRVLKELKARHRWCLTGSPMFNRVEDFGALLSFLRITPFNDLRFFNSEVTNNLRSNPEKALDTLRKLVRSTSLRRTKASVFGDLEMQPRETRIEEVFLNDEERERYEILKKSYSRILETQPFSKKAKTSTQSIFQTISRLRRFCDHGSELLPRAALAIFEGFVDEDAVANELFKSSDICAICTKSLKIRGKDEEVDPQLDCGHPVCSRCEKKDDSLLTDGGSCRLCLDSRALTPIPSTTPGRLSTNPQSIDSMDFDMAYKPSSKVVALLKNLQAERADPTWPPLKSVVFSCWTKMLDQIEKALKLNGIQFKRIDGSKSDRARRTALEKFRTHEGYCVLLASIGSAGVGLDLTATSRVYMIEPQWSPMAEEQALDRVHRMGQTRNVVATRYVVRNSIEEYVIAVQEMKSSVIKRSLENNEHMEYLSVRERFMKYLEES